MPLQKKRVKVLKDEAGEVNEVEPKVKENTKK